MINEQNSTQTNTPTSNNVQYGYPSNRFDLMNISPMANPTDVYSYYPTNLYQPFGTFDEQTQWGSNENSSTPLQYHPSMYPPSSLDFTRNLFDYPPSTYSSYHLGYTPPTGEMPWNAHQQQQPTSMSLIGNKKSSIYDEYPSNNHHHGPMVVNDLLAQQLSSMNLTNNDSNALPGFTRPSGPKSYASVVSSDTINSTNNKPSPTIRSTSNVSNDSFNSQQSRYNRDRPQSSSNGSLLNWSTTTTTAPNKISSSEHQYNPKDFNFNPKGARFFVIKSYSEDDVHRSIKYNIWCSTEHGNKRLDTAFREREGKGPIYLFFSVNASGHFCGMAEMMSPVDYEHQNDVWHMSNKWQGQFEVKWIYVKDVPNQQFRNIRLENNENKPVTNSRDTQEIPYEKGKLMLKTIHMYRHKTSIFDDFQYYESKQAEENTNKQSTDSIRTSSSLTRTGKRLGQFHPQQE